MRAHVVYTRPINSTGPAAGSCIISSPSRVVGERVLRAQGPRSFSVGFGTAANGPLLMYVCASVQCTHPLPVYVYVYILST